MKKIILPILFLLFSANICFAATRINLQPIYNALVNAGQAAALLAIIWGGVRYVLSIGDPYLMGEARTWVISGFTGLAIIVCANIIITKVTEKPPVLEITREVIFPSVPLEPVGFVRFYSKSECPKIGDSDIPDLNYYLGGSTTSIPEISKQIKSIEVINKEEEKEYVWGYIAFNEIGYMGNITKDNLSGAEGCQSINGTVQSIAIFNIATDAAATKGRVIFYEGTLRQGGSVVVKNPDFSDFVELNSLPGEGGEKQINYEGTDRPKERREECEKLYNAPSLWENWEILPPTPYCLQSIRIVGKYGVLLSSTIGSFNANQLFMGPNGPTNLPTSPMWGGHVRPARVKIFPFVTK